MITGILNSQVQDEQVWIGSHYYLDELTEANLIGTKRDYDYGKDTGIHADQARSIENPALSISDQKDG